MSRFTDQLKLLYTNEHHNNSFAFMARKCFNPFHSVSNNSKLEDLNQAAQMVK
jgi:hypothetical protein